MAETAHFNCLYEDGPENALWKGKWGCLCHAVCPKVMWGSFKKDVCSLTIMSSWTPYIFTRKLVLYTAVTERSWCHPLHSHPRGQIYSFCIIIVCPCTLQFFPQYSKTFMLSLSIIFAHFLHLVLILFITRRSALHPRVDQVALISNNMALCPTAFLKQG